MSLTVEISNKLKDFTLNIKIDTKGEPIGLLGASGCGKSLTLKCIAGITKPNYGKIILNDKILFDSEKRIDLPPQQRGTGFLFQNYALFPNMTVSENIGIAVKDKKRKKTITDKMITLFHLSSLHNRYPHQLSGGEQQRVALGRMMAYEPEVLMFDEPFSAMDSFLKDQLQQELQEVLQEYSGDVIMVSHNRDELYRFCQTIVVINNGQMIEKGNKEEVFGKPIDIITARLTGCKNISKAIKISDYEVRATDWNASIKTDRYVEDEICYVGIRAHNIKPASERDIINTLPVTLMGFSEGPFEDSLILNNRNNTEEGKLWWIISKKEWRETLKQQLPQRISLPMEHILLLKDNSQN